MNQNAYRQQRIVKRFVWPWAPVTLSGKTRRFGFVRIIQIIAMVQRGGKYTGQMSWVDWIFKS